MGLCSLPQPSLALQPRRDLLWSQGPADRKWRRPWEEQDASGNAGGFQGSDMSSVDSEAQCGQGGAPGFGEGTKVTAGGLQRLDPGGRWGRCIQEGK